MAHVTCDKLIVFVVNWTRIYRYRRIVKNMCSDLKLSPYCTWGNNSTYTVHIPDMTIHVEVTMICCFLLGRDKTLKNLSNHYLTQTASEMVQINKPVLARLCNTGFESKYSQLCPSLCNILYCMHPVWCSFVVI